MAKTIGQYELEAAAIRQQYRKEWANDPRFRLGPRAEATVGSSTTEAAAFAKLLATAVEAKRPALAGKLPGFKAPGVLAGLAGLVAGLVDEQNLARLRSGLAQAPDGAEKRAAVRAYLVEAVQKGIAAGLVDTVAWTLVDALVDLLLQGENLASLLASTASLGRLAAGLGSVVCLKLLVDCILYARGWTTKHPLGRKNLAMTATTTLLATAMAPFILGPASAVVALVVGSFLVSYLDAIFTEWEQGISLRAVLRRRLASVLAWLRGAPQPGVVWDVPEALAGEIPTGMECQITGSLFTDPWLLHDMPFEKAWLVQWITQHGTHPLNVRMQVSLSEIRPADELRLLCHELAQQYALPQVASGLPS